MKTMPCLRERGRIIMEDGQWRTLRELAQAMRDEFGKAGSDSGISAKLRDLRKRKYGLRTVESRRTTRPDQDASDDVWEYRLLTATTSTAKNAKEDNGCFAVLGVLGGERC